MDAVFPAADAICNRRAPHTCTAPSKVSMIFYFAESLYFVRSSIQLPTVKETDAQ